ncbi:MAG: YkgJ family cysteine cluster protein [Cyanobacteria bacterium]|nr:YkgJ family cysteine cluster protein [Cyanobacteriota bacterium]
MTGPEKPSPLGFAQEVEKLMKLPQHLCKQRGICCRIATFKGSLNVDDIRKLSLMGDEPGAEMARDFLSVFEPYATTEEVVEMAPEFVDRVKQTTQLGGGNPDNVSFFKCRFVLADGRCGVHEDRPVGCRTYPFPHKDTIYHPGCGFEQQGKANWQRIEEIIQTLEAMSNAD